jgi:carbamoyl-phosphate synthase large subunit
MKSTGEVMGIAEDFAMAFAKSQVAAGLRLPTEGRVLLSLRDRDKTEAAVGAAVSFAEMGFELCATEGTAAWLRGKGLACERVNKVREGRPHIVDAIINGEIALVVNTPSGKHPRKDEIAIRSTSWARRTPIITTIRAAVAAAQATRKLKQTEMTVKTLQEYTVDTHGEVPAPRV